MNDSILTIGLLVILISGAFVLASTADIPFYRQDVYLQEVSFGIFFLGLLVLVLGFLSGGKTTERHS